LLAAVMEVDCEDEDAKSWFHTGEMRSFIVRFEDSKRRRLNEDSDPVEPPEKRARKEEVASDKPRLLYFNIPGKGESIRLAFHYGKILFEDYRFHDRSEFTKMKESGELQFGQVPALVVKGRTLIQSAAIMRYVGRQAGLYPENPIVAAKVDAIMDQEADSMMGMRVTKYKERFGFGEWILTSENVEKLQATINAEVLPRHLSQLQTILKNGGTGWLAGTEGPTIADFFWVPTLQQLEKGVWNGDKHLMDSYGDLTDLVQRFLALPAIAEYYREEERSSKKTRARVD